MGAPDELARFCRAEYPRVAGALRWFVGDAAVAEELAQEAFVRLCQHWTKVRQLDSPGGWVHHVAMNLARSHRRRRAAERRALARADRAPERGGSTDNDRAGHLAVAQAVAALPEDQRAALVLRYYADLSVAETAAALRCPEGTVKTWTARALEQLRSRGLIDDEERCHA